MSIEQIFADHTAALNRHSTALEGFVKASGKGGDAQATDEKPARTRGSASAKADAKAETEKVVEKKAEPEKAAAKDEPTIYDIAKTFLDFGKEDDREDEDERERRAGFMKKVIKFFDVERARDIPDKNFNKVKRWLKLFADGEKVDFDVD